MDSETYPVADAISLKWYEGEARKPNKDRWAFAFSAKKDWVSKVRSDVKSIASTSRNYTQIYFISNQSISDKKRAQHEDKLSNEFGIPLRILDKHWLIEKVYENKRFEIAASVLDFPFSMNHKRKTGPRDAAKLAEIEDLEKSIDYFDSEKDSAYTFVEDCLLSATLSKQLEEPKQIVYRKYERALDAAQKFQSLVQQKKIIYNFGFGSYGWYDDYEKFLECYDQFKGLLEDPIDISDIEKWCTMHTLLITATFDEEIDTQILESREMEIRQSLEIVSMDKERPNASMLAKSNLLMIDLMLAYYKNDNPERIYAELIAILENSSNLMDFPVGFLIEVILEISEYIGESPEFDKLFECVIEIDDSRVSNSNKGALQLKKGFREIRLGYHQNALKSLGSACSLLATYEDKHSFIKAECCLGSAYEECGLLWAARGCYIIALDRVYREYSSSGKFPNVSDFILRRLIWVELLLGRPLQSLYWHLIYRSAIIQNATDIAQERQEEMINYDEVLGLFVLKTKQADVHRLDFLPSLFERLGLEHSRIAALYLLGYEDAIWYEYKIKVDELSKLCRQWINQPAAQDLPNHPNWGFEANKHFQSKILGVTYCCSVFSSLESIGLAEGLLACLESMLATGFSKSIYPVAPSVMLDIHEHGGDNFLIDVSEDKYGDRRINMSINNEIEKAMREDAGYKKVMEIVVMLINEGVAITDEEMLKKLAHEDFALHRASQFTQFPSLTRVLYDGHEPWDVEFFKRISGTERFSQLRQSHWVEGDFGDQLITEKNDGDKKPPADFLHHNTYVSPVIVDRLWNDAGWRGTGFIYGNGQPPVFLLVFENIEEGKKIFRRWKRDFGRNNEKIAISIITKIDKNAIHDYNVVIGQGLDNILEYGSGHIFCQSRISRRMSPSSSKNLEGFKKYFSKYKYLHLLPADFHDKNPKIVQENLLIETDQINFVEAWEIGPNDPERVIITEELEPIVPVNVSNPPYLDVLKILKNK